MYTAPAFARRGVGRLILARCEAAAAAEDFTSVELMATLSGFQLYTACGYEVVERLEHPAGGVVVPLVRMRKILPEPVIQPPSSLPIWSEKVSTESTPNSRIDQISPASRHPRTRIGAGSDLRLIRISSPE